MTPNLIPTSEDYLDALARVRAILGDDAEERRKHMPADGAAICRAVGASEHLLARVARMSPDPLAAVDRLALLIDVESSQWGEAGPEPGADPAPPATPATDSEKESGR